ncbi:MAG: TIR domain-containing protein [Bacteroidetes bacterium]|nr:TIR domain-containing protein [Bacteroidota bacterium]
MIDNNSADKQSRVISELDSSDIMILIESASIYKSEWVSIEIQRAEENHIPIKKISITELTNFTRNQTINFATLRNKKTIKKQ